MHCLITYWNYLTTCTNDCLFLFSGMDSLALVKQHTALAVLFVVLHHIASLPYGGRQPLPFSPYGNGFTNYMPYFPQVYNPFQAMPVVQPMNPNPVYFRNPMPAPHPPMPRTGMWNYNPVYRTQLPKVISRPKKQKISVLSGPLNHVMPYPNKNANHIHMKQKKKARMHSVAKAKTFSGILKNTALDTGKVWENFNVT